MQRHDTDGVKIDETAVAEVWREINDLVGLRPFKEWLVTTERSIRYSLATAAAAANTTIRVAFPSWIVFSGPPGCGKTTAAVLASRLLHALGVVERKVVGKVSVSELKLSYLSHATTKIKDVLDAAKNGALIIEEAPVFDDNDHVRLEVLYALLHELQADEYQGTFIVFTELNEQIDVFLAEHPAFAPFLTRVDFASFTADECSLMLERSLGKQGCVINEEVFQHVKKLAHYEQLTKGNLFANAFWIQRLVRCTTENARERALQRGAPGHIITTDDLGTFPATFFADGMELDSPFSP
jgi:hypothetical protein